MNTTAIFSVLKIRHEKNSVLFRICLFVRNPGWMTQTLIHQQLQVGLLAQLAELCTGIAEVRHSNPVQAWIFSSFFFFFRPYFHCCLSINKKSSLLQRLLLHSKCQDHIYDCHKLQCKCIVYHTFTTMSQNWLLFYINS